MRLALCALGILCSTAAHAGTFYNPLGDAPLEMKGAAAAATLNEALSSLHLMYAAVERKQGDLFQRHREMALKQLTSSLEQFQGIENQVPTRELKISPKTDIEKETIESFLKYALPAHKIAPPKTERELVHVAVVLISALRNRLEKNDVKPGSDDWRPVRELIRIQLDLAGAGLAVSLIFSPQK
jgi:hypothetical protein